MSCPSVIIECWPLPGLFWGHLCMCLSSPLDHDSQRAGTILYSSLCPHRCRLAHSRYSGSMCRIEPLSLTSSLKWGTRSFSDVAWLLWSRVPRQLGSPRLPSLSTAESSCACAVRLGKPSDTALLSFYAKGWLILLFFSPISPLDTYKLTSELLGEGAYAKVQGAVSLQNGKEYAVKVSVSSGCQALLCR